ncbi:MAG: hypothetical protein CHACPFDD_01318 [Phycisphaerae bacterium]|nr:hypothetical protein [Phycisphaerae bacterium]
MEGARAAFYTVRGMLDILNILYRRLVSDDPYAVVVELTLIALTINWCVNLLHGTRGTRLFKGLLIVLIVATLGVRILSVQFGWTRLELLYRNFVIGLGFMALVAFQPELRRAFIRAGDVRLRRRGSPQSKTIAALVESAGHLSRQRHGALIAIQRDVGLGNWAENGTPIWADVSANLISTIFFPNSPLHDLGVIIHGSKVVAANCQFPAAESDELDVRLGSRHRAAVGLSLESDALVVVVSEETGTISLADGGRLTRFLSIDELGAELTERLAGVRDTAQRGALRIRTLSDAWRLARRALVVVPLTIVIWYVADQASQVESPGVKVEVRASAAAPTHMVDIVAPERATFTVVFRGSTSSMRELIESNAGPLVVDWRVDESWPNAKSNSIPAAAVIDASAAVQKRGLQVQSVTPANLQFIVDRLETIAVPVRLETGEVNVADAQVNPAEARVTLRSREWAQLAPGQRSIAAPVEVPREAFGSGKVTQRSGVTLARRVGAFTATAVEPATVDVSFRVIGRTVGRTLRGVPVSWLIPEALEARYRVVPRDVADLLVDVDVEGDKSAVDALDPQAVVAYVQITGDMYVPGASAWQTVEVQLTLPAGVSMLNRPRLQLRLEERAGQP